MSTPTAAPVDHPVRRVVRLAVHAVLTFLVLLSLAWVASGLLGYERYVITGGSMSGEFEAGAIAFEQAVPVGDLEVGDVITYLPPPDSGVTSLVTHRITDISRAQDGTALFTTQGDANADPDPWEFGLTADTQPVVRFTVPTVGYALMALTDPATRMLVIGVPAGVIALLALVELARALRPGQAGPDAAAVTAPTTS
jgi:signal peptidase I